MTSMKDCPQVEVTGDADAVASELYVENTVENPAWYTVENNHVSLVSENIEKVIKLETDMLNDCMWESRIEITKYVDNQSYMELPLESQDVTDNIYLNPGNTSDIIFYCNICGKSFVYNYLLKKHLAKHKKQVNYKTNKCKFCGKSFELKYGLDRHIQKHHNSMRATIVSNALHTNIPNNDIISYPEQTKIISNNNSPDLNIKQEINFGTTLRETNSSDQMNLANSNESNVLTASQNSMTNILNIKKEKDLIENDKERNNSDQVDSINSNESILANEPRDLMEERFPINTANSNESNVLTTTQNSMANIQNIKQEKDLYTIVRERNSSDQVDSINSNESILANERRDLMEERFPINTANSNESNVLTTSQNSMANIQNIKQEKDLYTNVRERNSSDQVDSINSNESILANERRDLMEERFPINTANSNESNVLTTSQNSMANIQNIKQEKDLYTNVRERNSSDQVDSINSNESILANEPRYLRAEQFPINTANNNIVSIARDTPYFYIIKLSNIKNEFRNDDYDQTSQNKLIFTCRICKNPPSTDIHSFALHMNDHRECNMYECIVCDKTFNSVVPWTDHMTYHQQQIDLNVSTVQLNFLETESNTFDPINSRNLEPQVFTNLKDRKCKTTSNTDSATMSRNQKKETKSSSTIKTNFCNLCNRQFTKRCYFTNHMMMKHNINTNTAKQLTSIDCNESIILSENIELTNEYENKLSVPVNNKNNNHVHESNKKKSTFCVFCNKHFAHLGAFTNHMRIHAVHPCDVCEKKFSTPFHLNVHRKSHSILKIESISHKDKIKCRHCKKECNSISQWKNHMSISKECKSYLPEFTSNKTVLDKTYLNTYDNIGSQKDKLLDIIQQKPVVKKRSRSNYINGAKCELCGKIYCNEYNLIRHISMIHKKTYKPMNCNICGITLKNKFSHEAHSRKKHKHLFKHHEETNYSTYKRTGGQIISVNKKNIMTYICKICNMKFVDNITLQKHTKIHTLNMYKCNYCGEQYETNLALGNHIWESHSDI